MVDKWRCSVVVFCLTGLLVTFFSCKGDSVTSEADPSDTNLTPADSLAQIVQNLNGSYLGQDLPGITPEIFAQGIISAEEREAFLVTLPGGNELYYAIIDMVNNNAVTEIFYTKIVDGHWIVPVNAPFTSNYLDGYFAVHPNGSRFYFQSDRPVDNSESTFDYNIWYMDRTGDTWGEPESIGTPVNGQDNVSGPSVTLDGTMYYTIMASDGDFLYRSKLVDGVYQEPERLPVSVNSVNHQFDSYIAPDESYLIFNATLADTYGEIDIYVCFRDENDNWSDPVNMGPTVNTSDYESSATITPDGEYIFFFRINGNNEMDIYWVDADILDNLKPDGY
ncbi:MAG: hypothetical protein GY863_17965 [bacterium]|nr:hypothetical protein [bacterium]